MQKKKMRNMYGKIKALSLSNFNDFIHIILKWKLVTHYSIKKLINLKYIIVRVI